jgi:hypothetical protein
MARDLAITAVSVMIGGLITWGVSWWYYVQAAKGLAEEAEKLRRRTDILIGIAMNPHADKEVQYDHKGAPVSVAVSATGTATAKPSTPGEGAAGGQTDP